MYLNTDKFYQRATLGHIKEGSFNIQNLHLLIIFIFVYTRPFSAPPLAIANHLGSLFAPKPCNKLLPLQPLSMDSTSPLLSSLATDASKGPSCKLG